MAGVRVSVVIPTYDRREAVRGAVRSALGQSVADLEVIVVDDGSRDGTAAALRADTADDPRVRVIERENGGTAAARNTGIDAARGTYLALLDSDDEWRPGYLAAQLARLDASGADAVFSDAHVQGGLEDGGTIMSHPGYRPPLSLERMIEGAWGLPSASVMKTEVARALRFSTEYFSEDTEFLYRFHASGYRCVMNPEPLVLYRRHHDLPGPSQRGHDKARMLRDRVRLLREYRHRAERPHHVDVEIARNTARLLTWERRWRDARPHIFRWWRARPTSRRAWLFLLRSLILGNAAGSNGDNGNGRP